MTARQALCYLSLALQTHRVWVGFSLLLSLTIEKYLFSFGIFFPNVVVGMWFLLGMILLGSRWGGGGGSVVLLCRG